MAIYSHVPPPEQHAASETSAAHPQSSPATNSYIDIDAWTVSALQSLSISPIARGTGSPLTIPIDDRVVPKERTVAFHEAPKNPLNRPPSRRDSQRRRELVLKGNEGSRQRRRWENDRLIGVPNVQPPQPVDWEAHPTHPVHRVPYQVAQFWDRGVRELVQDRTAKLQAARKKQQLKTGSATGLGIGEVPRDLRETAKRSPVVRDWVRVLEEPVRQFLNAGNAQEQDEDIDSAAEDMDSDDEEIVFVGRNGAMRELQEKKPSWKMARREVSQQTVDSGVVFDSFGDDESAAFKRWLTHSISDYYGLASRSVTVGNSKRKVVYVGLKQARQRTVPPPRQLPRPLWEQC